MKVLFAVSNESISESIIKKYSIKLVSEVDKKYNETNLKRMRQFYYIIEKGVALPHQLSWSHILVLLPINNIDEINLKYRSAMYDEHEKYKYLLKAFEEILKFWNFEILRVNFYKN